MTKKIKKIKIFNQRFFSFLFFANIFLFGTYLFFVGATTINVVERKNFEEELKTLESKRASLEEFYNEATRTYTKDYAYQIGFIEAVRVFYTNDQVDAFAYDKNASF